MDSEVMKVLTTFVPLYAMIGMFAVCYVLRNLITHPPDFVTPQWFIGVVFLVGQIVGGVMWASTTEAVIVNGLEWWQIVGKVFMQGLGYGGAVVLLWEIRKRVTFLPEWFFPDKAAEPKP